MTDYTATRSMLKKLANAEPGNTAIRRAAFNMLEMTENLEKLTGQWEHQLPHLMGALGAEIKRLAELQEEARNRNAGE
jgi:thymidine phosphorylase